MDAFREAFIFDFDSIVKWFRSSGAIEFEGPSIHPAMATLEFKELCRDAYHHLGTEKPEIADAKRLIRLGLAEWMSKYSLKAPWMAEVLLETAYWSFLRWLEGAHECAPSHFLYPAGGNPEPVLGSDSAVGEFATAKSHYPGFHLAFPGFMYPHLPTKQLEALIRRAFEDELRRYVAVIRVVDSANGRIGLSSGASEADHFVWLIKYQVLGNSQNQVAREFSVTREAAKQGIKRAADLIGLELRVPSMAGRPKSPVYVQNSVGNSLLQLIEKTHAPNPERMRQ